MAARTVFGRRSVELEGKSFRFELRPDGLHIREHNSRSVGVVAFTHLLQLAKDKATAIIMKTPRRRYLSEGEILKEIDLYRVKATEFIARAETQEKLAHTRQVEGVGWAAKEALEAADLARASATRILDGKLKRLQDKLAEFRTPHLPGIEIDNSVQA